MSLEPSPETQRAFELGDAMVLRFLGAAFWPSPLALLWLWWMAQDGLGWAQAAFPAVAVLWAGGFLAWRGRPILAFLGHVWASVRPRPARIAAFASPLPKFDWLKVLADALGAAWRYRRIVALVLAALLIWRVFGPALHWGWSALSPFAHHETKAELRVQIREAEIETQARAHEVEVAHVAVAAAETTHRVETRTAATVAQGQDEISHAVTQNDFDALYLAYAGAYERVWNDAGGDAREPDSAPRRPNAMHEARSDLG